MDHVIDQDTLAPAGPGPRLPGAPVLVTDLASRTLAIKEGETFLYTDTEGNLDDRKELGLGFYHRDTRFLSHFLLKVGGRSPVLLSSSSDRSYLAHVDLTNPELFDDEGEPVAPQQTLNVRRIRTINGRLYERIRVKNYHPRPVVVDVDLSFGADFADVFEVRGLARERTGTYEPPVADGKVVSFAYRGLDGRRRETRIELGSDPDVSEVVGDLAHVRFRLKLGPYQTRLLSLTVEPIIDEHRPPRIDFDAAVHDLRRSYEDWEREATRVVTDNELFNQLLDQGLRDLRALYTPVDGGGVLAAGIPWYVTTFGRDGLIAAHQLLMINPRLTRDVLVVLAHHQGWERDDWRDEEPGKILHESRQGELAAAGLIPHTPYYGSVDSTPWFLILAAQYLRWTGDVTFARELEPAIDAALGWIDHHGDADGDGLVEYVRRSPGGIRNQGWKDSVDAVLHADGTRAEPPIALVEVQAYVHLAKLRIADVYEALGRPERARRLQVEAAELRERFHRAFWMPDERYYAMALDGDKRQVRTVTSNPGHALYCDILDPEPAQELARRLLAPDMFSGWGVRTMSKSAAAYNPMSYHNGSVWPHDNALIAAGLKRYGFARATNRIATGLFDSAIHAEHLRLPELFCGFTRRSPNKPVAYPVACSPQAWAAGSPFLMLQSMLGISARAHENLLTVNHPQLPAWLNAVELQNLRVGDSRITLLFRRDGDITGFSLLQREGDVRVVMEE
ncbi:MAG TPA: amylo-alpha-1,6-glucosidase [Actinomycetota bacterium]|nr:amylo-alpha-1,6-glucosidase [Actinomycetota bacterium]